MILPCLAGFLGAPWWLIVLAFLGPLVVIVRESRRVPRDPDTDDDWRNNAANTW